MEKVILYRSRTEAEIDNLIWNGNGVFLEVFVALGIWVAVLYGLYGALNYSSVRKFCFKNKFFSYHIGKFIFALSLPITYVAYKLFFKLLMVI